MIEAAAPLAVPDDLVEALPAMHRLNSHARSARGAMQRAIYAYKELLAIDLGCRDLIGARLVGVVTKCLNCDGTGKFISWYDGPTGEPCRTCGRTGRVTLKFVETTTPDGAAWHHPYDKATDILRAAWGHGEMDYEGPGVSGAYVFKGGMKDGRPAIFEFADGWRPQQPGMRLESDALARDLTLVERWIEDVARIPRRETPVPQRFPWAIEKARAAVRSYDLDLDQPPGPCLICSGDVAADDISFGFVQNYLHWRRKVCRPCYEAASADGRYGAGKLDLPMPPPEQLTPAIVTWLARRGIDPATAVLWRPKRRDDGTIVA